MYSTVHKRAQREVREPRVENTTSRSAIVTSCTSLLALSVVVIVPLTAEQKNGRVTEIADELKELRLERVKTLETLVENRSADFVAGRVICAEVLEALDSLTEAQLEMEEVPERRVALLERRVAFAEEVQRMASVRRGVCTTSDVVEVKAYWLGARIALLQEGAKLSQAAQKGVSKD